MQTKPIALAAIILMAAIVIFFILRYGNSLPAAPSAAQGTTSIGPASGFPATTTQPNYASQPSTSNGASSFAYQPLTITVPSTDPFNDPSGPYYHDIYVATSKNGLNFTSGTLLWDHGSVPGAVLVGNTVFVYYVDGTGSSPSGLIAARSADQGKTWTRYALVFNPSILGTCGAVDPDPVPLANGSIKLFVTCSVSPGSGYGYIGTATSRDGITFNLDPGQRVSTPAGQRPYTDPDAVDVDGHWGLYVSQGIDDLAFNSTNGINFTYIGTASTVGAVSGSIELPNGSIRHYFCGRDGIDSAISGTPSSNWTTEPGMRIPAVTSKIVCDPSPVLLTNGTYALFYKIQQPPKARQ